MAERAPVSSLKRAGCRLRPPQGHGCGQLGLSTALRACPRDLERASRWVAGLQTNWSEDALRAQRPGVRRATASAPELSACRPRPPPSGRLSWWLCGRALPTGPVRPAAAVVPSGVKRRGFGEAPSRPAAEPRRRRPASPHPVEVLPRRSPKSRGRFLRKKCTIVMLKLDTYLLRTRGEITTN